MGPLPILCSAYQRSTQMLKNDIMDPTCIHILFICIFYFSLLRNFRTHPYWYFCFSRSIIKCLGEASGGVWLFRNFNYVHRAALYQFALINEQLDQATCRGHQNTMLLTIQTQPFTEDLEISEVFYNKKVCYNISILCLA